MCGRFTLTISLGAVALRFGVRSYLAEGTPVPRYNIAPTQTVVVSDDGTRYLTPMRWGLIPSWAKDPAIGNRMINARAETVATRLAFRAALRKRRCLVVADGFYVAEAYPGKTAVLSRPQGSGAVRVCGAVGDLDVTRGRGNQELHDHHGGFERAPATDPRPDAANPDARGRGHLARSRDPGAHPTPSAAETLPR